MFGMVNQHIENHGLGIFGVVGFDLGPLVQGQMRTAKLKVLITRLLFIPVVWDGKPTYRKSWAGNLVAWSDLTLGPSFKVKRGQPNLKVLITRLLLSVSQGMLVCVWETFRLRRLRILFSL